MNNMDTLYDSLEKLRKDIDNYVDIFKLGELISVSKRGIFNGGSNSETEVGLSFIMTWIYFLHTNGYAYDIHKNDDGKVNRKADIYIDGMTVECKRVGADSKGFPCASYDEMTAEIQELYNRSIGKADILLLILHKSSYSICFGSEFKDIVTMTINSIDHQGNKYEILGDICSRNHSCGNFKIIIDRIPSTAHKTDADEEGELIGYIDILQILVDNKLIIDYYKMDDIKYNVLGVFITNHKEIIGYGNLPSVTLAMTKVHKNVEYIEVNGGIHWGNFDEMRKFRVPLKSE